MIRFSPLLLFIPCFGFSTESVADQPLGIVKTKPISGRFVKTHRGYMVPYKTEIPGTDVEYEMVPIPGGTFVMGSPIDEPGRSPNEGPQIKVKVKPFWMGKYEVTWKQYKEYLALMRIFKEFDNDKIRQVTDNNRIDAITAPSEIYDPECVFENGESPEHAAAMMTQYAARQYTKWVSGVSGRFYRLPTGAEWEYACRAGTTTAYHFGDDTTKLDDYAWYRGNSDDSRKKVGLKKPNQWGLFDMYGNVSEWVIDFEDGEGYVRGQGKTMIADRDIRWPKSLDNQIVRGGSFELKAKECRSASMLLSNEADWKDEDPCLPQSPWWFTSEPATGVGFRIIRPLSVPMTKELRYRFHGPDVKETLEAVMEKSQNSGRGVFGIVDQELPKAIKKLLGDK